MAHMKMLKHFVVPTLRRKLARACNAFIALALAGNAAFAVAQVYIMPPSWNFFQETASGDGGFVSSPGVPPSGSPISVQLAVGAPGGELFATQQFAGTPLSQIVGLSYNSYVVSTLPAPTSPPETATLQFDFDPGQTPAPSGYQGRAVFSPSLMTTAPVQNNVWQTWNPMTQRAWFGTGNAASRVLAAACSQAAPCTWAEMRAAFPNSKMLAAPSAFGFKLGNSNRAGVVLIDSFSMGTAGVGGPIIHYTFPRSWNFLEETPTGVGMFVTGPGVPPSGSVGSAQLAVAAPGGELFSTPQFAGTPLDQVVGLSYNSYVVSSTLPETATLQFDFDPGQTSSGYQGRAVFSPSLLSPTAVQVGVWQTWNPMTQRAWYGTGNPANRVLAAVCSQAVPCTWSEILAWFSNAKILPDQGKFGFKLGNSNSAGVVSVDSFSMGTAGVGGPVTQYIFTPVAPVQCVAGTYSANGFAPCTNATPGNYVPNVGATSAIPASLGHFVAGSAATAEQPCVAGSYAPTTGASSCTLASAGSYVATAAASVQLPCNAGRYSAVAGMIACTPASVNFYVPTTGATAQIPCPLGATSGVGATSCTSLPILNIDDSDAPTKYDAGTDGALLTRYLFGLRGTALTAGVLGANARRDAAQIVVHLATYVTLFDVDGDGQTLAHTDGLMIVRRMLGLSGTALTTGAKNSARSDADIAAAIDALRP